MSGKIMKPVDAALAWATQHREESTGKDVPTPRNYCEMRDALKPYKTLNAVALIEVSAHILADEVIRLRAALAPFAKLGEVIATQDNYGTMHPAYCAQSKSGRMGQWETKSIAFTHAGADGYIAQDGHNMRQPRVYVESFCRNREMIALREAMLAAHKLVGKEVANG